MGDEAGPGRPLFDAANQVLYVADAGQNRVYRICKSPLVSVPWAEGPRAPSDVTALAVTPNPARGSARITWSLQRRADARVTIFDLAGRAVRRVSDGMHEAGTTSRTWDGRDQDGHPVAAGLYLVRVETDRGARTSRITVLR